MAIPILNHLDFGYAAEAQKLILHKTTEASATNTEGAIIYDTSTDTIKYRNASAWVSLTASSSVTVSDNSGSTAMPVVFNDESNNLHDDTGAFTYKPSTGMVTATGFTGALTGNASTATALANARTIGGTSFDGTANIAVGLAATATALASARTIGGVSFDGTANISLVSGSIPDNAADTSGNAATATKVASITNSNIVQLTETQTLTNKTLTAPTLTTPALGTPSALVLTNATALPAAQVAQGTMASGMVLVAPALGTPASGVMTNVSGTAASLTAGNATLASTVTITDKSDNVNYDVLFGNSTSAIYDDTGALYYNPSTGNLRVPNLTVAGTTTTVDTVTMQAANAVIFEGATADEYETTLTITDPTADRTITMQNASGTLAFTSDITTATPDADLTTKGIVELATIAETNTGTDAGRAVTPDGLDGWTGSAQVTTLGTIGTGTWQGTAINQTYLTGQSGTNTGDETLSSINALDVTELGTISSGVWQGTVVAAAYLPDASASAEGVVELATAAEVLVGTDTARVVTADTLSAKSVTAIIAAASVDSTQLSARINHNLGTTSLLVVAQLINEDGTTDYGNCIIDWECTTDGSTDSTNDIFVKFATTPPSNVYVNISSINGATAITPTYPS